jgi:predicted DNA-binding transcriptional regulator YafY
LFAERKSVRYERYADRFDRSLRSFRRDLATMRDAGLYLDTDQHGEYRMLCFRPEPDAA